MFVGVNSQKFDLANLKLINAAGDGTETIQIIDKDGLNTETWTWLTAENSGTEDGWFDNSTWAPISKSVESGVGFLMNVGADVDMSVSGAVGTEEIIYALSSGFNVVGNSTPVNIDLQSIKILNGAGDGTETIQIIDKDGLNTETWTWLTAENSGTKDGWFDNSTWAPIKETINAGTALLFNVGADVKVKIPSAL